MHGHYRRNSLVPSKLIRRKDAFDKNKLNNMEISPINTEYCIENQIYKHSKKNHLIYIIVVISIIVAMALMPFIYVNIVIHSSGMVRPITEKVEIKSPLTEMVQGIMVHEGDKVQAGDTILTFNTASIDAKINYQHEIKKDYEDQISDLRNFIEYHTVSFFHSAKRQLEMLLFKRQQDEIKLRIADADKKLSRNKQLFQSGAISEEEYENYLQAKNENVDELKTLTQNRFSEWESDLNELQNSLNETNTTLDQLYRERKMYTIQAPVNGTLDQFSGIYQGAFLLSGQFIASISPDSTLLIESYVLPKDIGFLYKGMPVNIQVESFNYNQWGMLHGNITDISSDFIVSNNTAYYDVKCNISRTFLKMRNGQKGYLKKGMDVQTHFLITKRTLLQLVYQDFNEWVNPTLRSANQNSKQPV